MEYKAVGFPQSIHYLNTLFPDCEKINQQHII